MFVASHQLYFLTEVQLIYIPMFALGVQHSDSIFLWNILYLKESQNDCISLCCSSLFLLRIAVCVPYSPTPSCPSHLPLHWWLLVLCTVTQFQCRRHGFYPWVRKIPWRRKWHPPPVFLPGDSHGQRSLWATQSMGSHRAGLDWATEQQQHLFWGVYIDLNQLIPPAAPPHFFLGNPKCLF